MSEIAYGNDTTLATQYTPIFLMGPTSIVATAGNGATSAAPTSTPVAVNASTTYGLDPSAANNFGLGPQYMSTSTLAAAQAIQQAQPSWWWLVGFFVLAAVLL